MSEPPAVIVIAQSARALASAARRAGYAPLAIDLFGDEDLRAASAETVVVAGGLSKGFTYEAAVEAVGRLIRTHAPVGVVYGSGFEDRIEILAALAELTTLIGNDAPTVGKVKDPAWFAQACASEGVAHPEVAFGRPGEGGEWLRKRKGGAGGAHVQPVNSQDDGGYFQRRVPGRSVSALFVADGDAAQILGLSEQWTAAGLASPFRYGGAAGPIEVEAPLRDQIERAVAAIARAFGLRGLNSGDFQVDDDIAWLIEINPRPGATLDIFDSDNDPLFARHVSGVRLQLAPPARHRSAGAHQIVYAEAPITVATGLAWPPGAADRPVAGMRIEADDPLCTVIAYAATAEEAKRLVAERAASVRSMFASVAT